MGFNKEVAFLAVCLITSILLYKILCCGTALISESYDGKSRAVHVKFAFSEASYHSGKLPFIGMAKAIYPSKLREFNHSLSFF